MNKLQSKSNVAWLILTCSFLNMGVSHADPSKPNPPPPVNTLSPMPSPEELNAHREYMKTYKAFWTITVALTTQNARNPQPLSKGWLKRIASAAGMPLKYLGVGGGDMHRFELSKKMIPTEGEEIAARIRALPGNNSPKCLRLKWVSILPSPMILYWATNERIRTVRAE